MTRWKPATPGIGRSTGGPSIGTRMAGELLTITFGTLLCTAAAGADVAASAGDCFSWSSETRAHALRESLLQFGQVRGAVIRKRREVALRDLEVVQHDAARGLVHPRAGCGEDDAETLARGPFGQDRHRAAEIDPVVGPAAHLRLIDEDSRAGQLDFARPGRSRCGCRRGRTRRRRRSRGMGRQHANGEGYQERMAHDSSIHGVNFHREVMETNIFAAGRLRPGRRSECPTPFVCAGRCCSPIMRVQNAQFQTHNHGRNTCHDRRRGSQAGTTCAQGTPGAHCRDRAQSGHRRKEARVHGDLRDGRVARFRRRRRQQGAQEPGRQVARHHLLHGVYAEECEGTGVASADLQLQRRTRLQQRVAAPGHPRAAARRHRRHGQFAAATVFAGRQRILAARGERPRVHRPGGHRLFARRRRREGGRVP